MGPANGAGKWGWQMGLETRGSQRRATSPSEERACYLDGQCIAAVPLGRSDGAQGRPPQGPGAGGPRGAQPRPCLLQGGPMLPEDGFIAGCAAQATTAPLHFEPATAPGPRGFDSARPTLPIRCKRDAPTLEIG